jgi:hypothetical protein
MVGRRMTLRRLLVVLAATAAVLVAAPAAHAGIDGTIEQAIPISAGASTWSSGWSATATAYSPTDDSMGLVQWDSTKFNGAVTVYFEAVFSSNSATAASATVGLFASGNTTTPVATVTNPANTSVNRVRSTAVTLTTATNYTVRTKVTAGATISLLAARLIVVQSSSWPSTITATQTNIELGDDFSTTSTAYALPTDTRFWALPSVTTKYDAGATCYFEGTIKSSVSGTAATLALVGVAGNTTPLTTVSTTLTAWTRVRSAAFTCTTAQTVHPELKSAAGTATASMQNARVIVEQSAAGLSKLETPLPLTARNFSTTSTTFTSLDAFLWEPANYASTPSSGMTVTAPFHGVAAKVSTASASAQVCNVTSGCSTNTPLAGSLISAINSTSTSWFSSGAVTLPASSVELKPQVTMNSAGTLTPTQSYLPIDVTFTGALQLVSAPTSSTLPGVALNGTSQSTSGTLGNMQVKDSRPTAPGWTLTASSTNFTSGANTISNTLATLTPGSVTTPNGSSLTGVSAGAGGALNVSRTIMSATAANGLGTYNVNPTEAAQINTTVKTGTYSATLTITLS